jgi:hypothetical protein
MSATFVYTSRFKVREGKLDEYRTFVVRLAALVQEQEPDMAHFGIYLDEDGSTITVVQVHKTAENMAVHMDLITPLMAEGGPLIDMSDMEISVCGTPTEAILSQMRQIAGSGASVSISSPIGTANHF